ncbi:MAG: helix-turn-helix transcriptional regulator [Clostridia bacterium]|nr:helix-turn-helix transcriptional regulator [Clostridia bacterium]
MDTIERIKRLLNERGWTPYRLAKEAGLPDATIGNIFRRNTMPTLPTLEAVCNAFGITLSQFFAEGDMVEMSPELKELFDNWVNLTATQKDAVIKMLKAMQNE